MIKGVGKRDTESALLRLGEKIPDDLFFFFYLLSSV